MRYIFCITLLMISWAKADERLNSYFDAERNFTENPLAASEIIDFYGDWFEHQEGKIKPLNLQALIPVEEGFIAHFSHAQNLQPFYVKISSYEPQSLISSPLFKESEKAYEEPNPDNVSLPQSQSQPQAQPEPQPQSQSLERDFSANPLTKEDIQNFYLQNPVKSASITGIKEDSTGFTVTFTNDDNMRIRVDKRIEKNNPNSLLFSQPSLLAPLGDLFPEFNRRNFELSPLSLVEVNAIYKKYGEKISPGMRGSYQGASYDENQNIRLTFKGGLSGKLFHHIVTPSEPNSLIIN